MTQDEVKDTDFAAERLFMIYKKNKFLDII